MEGTVAWINRQLEGNRQLSLTQRNTQWINTVVLTCCLQSNKCYLSYAMHVFSAGQIAFFSPSTRQAVRSSFIMSFWEADIKVTT